MLDLFVRGQEVNTHFIVYDGQGRILRIGDCPDFMVSVQAHEGESVVLGVADGATQYIDVVSGEVIERPVAAYSIDKTTALAGEEDEVTIFGLPAGSTIWIEHMMYVVDDGELSISFPLPGLYQIYCDCFPQLSQIFEVTVS